MKNEQIKAIQKSFRLVAEHSDVAASVFYNRLFEIEPDLRGMFPSDLTEQKQKLMKTLGVAVAGLERFSDLELVLKQLGKKHADYGVREEYYPIVGEALLWTLKNLLSAIDFDDQTEEAWIEMFEMISATMIRAARKPIVESVVKINLGITI